MGGIFAILIGLGFVTNSIGITPDSQIEYRFTASSVQTVKGDDNNYSITNNKVTKNGSTIYTFNNNTVYDYRNFAVFTVNSSELYEKSTGNRYTVQYNTIKKNGQVILNLL